MDRFVSASSAQDAISSLENLVDAFRTANKTKNDTGDMNTNGNAIVWEPAWIFEHEEIAEHLVWLLQHGTLKSNEIPCDEGVHLVCQLYQHLGKSSEAVKKPSPGILLESLLDVLDHSEHKHPTYVRVLALKVLEDISKRHKSTAVNQWLQAPNGLHRIADLLAIDVEINPMEEAIRNQALVVAKSLAREAPMAKVFLFAEVECKLLDLCWKEGGLTKGSPIVIDALELIHEVLKHADASLQDLVWQRPNVAPRLAQLLDLRGGEEFLHPKQPAKTTKSDGYGDGGGDDDDLDSLLASGDTAMKPKPPEKSQDAPIPRLLPSEEKVVQHVLDILRLLLESDSVRETVWKQHMGLCAIIWELALLSNPSNPPVCAMPTSSLQQNALSLIADKINDPVIMDRLSGLDRLLYLVCTGGGISDKFDDKLGTSQSALAVLRETLSGDRIHDILMRTLAPPPTLDENAPPPGPTVIQKLWNTVQENLAADTSEERTLFLSGALGGIGLMLCDEQSREIMSKVAPISLDQLLESLSGENEGFVQCSILRLLCEWTYECPFIAHSLLSSTASTNLAAMAAAPSSYQSLIHLLLGLAMEYLTNEEECGGWTRNGIIQIIVKIGISKYTTSLEGLKMSSNSKMPCVVSDLEFKSWKKFCSQAVLIIRKRVVQELAAGSSESDDESDHTDGVEENGMAASKEIKPLQKLVSQQAKEMEEMRLSLEVAQNKIAVQEDQMSTWKRRLESTPTELDDMLNEFTSKKVELEQEIRSMELEHQRQKSEKEKEIESVQEKLSKSNEESNRLRNEEKEVRDDLERTEQEMKALSQAYASLEEEFQKHQNELNAEKKQNASGSTEVTTLRAEISRLKNDARKADEWMSMAVDKMNEMGTANMELEQQVSMLNSQIEESRAVAERISLDDQNKAQERQNLEINLEKERALRLAAEEHLPHLEDLRMELEREKNISVGLQKQIADTEEALSKFENIESKMESEQTKSAELEKRISDAEEAARISAGRFEDERTTRLELEKELETNKSTQDHLTEPDTFDITERLEEMRAEYEKKIAGKDAKIDALRLSLQEKEEHKECSGGLISMNGQVTKNNEIDEIRMSSQEEIYRLESVIRELKDRLGSGLGTYKIEDIQERDEEIEELRAANEAAQEWMDKAVKHHQMNSAEIQQLSEDKVNLELQLEEERKKITCQNGIHSSAPSNGVTEKQQELDLMSLKMIALEEELKDLKQEKDANQGLLDEYGIAMDDVAVMQQQLSEYRSTISELETKVSESSLNEENEKLRLSNEDLLKRLREFEDWAQMVQTKISEIMIAKEQAERQVEEAREEIQALRDQNDSLRQNGTDANDIEKLKQEISTLESVNDTLSNEKDSQKRQNQDLQAQCNSLLASSKIVEEELTALAGIKNDLEKDLAIERTSVDKLKQEISKLESASNDTQKHRYSDLQSRYDDLLASSKRNEEELTTLGAFRKDLEKDLAKEKQLSLTLSSELEDLKTRNMALLDSIDELKTNPEHQVSNSVTFTSDTIDTAGESRDQIDTAFDEMQTERIQELTRELETTKAALAEANETLSSDEDVMREWEDRVAQLQSNLDDAHQQLHDHETEALEAISKWQESANALEEKCVGLEEKLRNACETEGSMDAHGEMSISEYSMLKEENASLQQKINDLETSLAGNSDNRIVELQQELKAAQDALENDEEVVQQWEEQNAALESTIESLEAELRQNEEESNDVISQWQDNCAAAEARCTTFEQELNDLKESMATQDLPKEDDATDQAAFESMADTLSEKEEQLRQLQDEAEETRASMEKLKDRCLLSEERCSHLELQIKEAVATKESEIQELRNKDMAQNDDRISESNRRIESITEELSNQEIEAKNTIQQWEERNSAMEEENSLLRKNLEEAEGKSAELLELRSIRSDDDRIIRRWEERVEELSESIAELEDQLKEQEQEAVDAIDQWQTTCTDLETKCANLENNFQNSLETISAQNWSLEQLKSRNENYCTQMQKLKNASERVESSLSVELFEAKSEISRLAKTLEGQNENLIGQSAQLQAELEAEKGKYCEARDEIDSLTATLEEIKFESVSTMNQWTERYAELEAALKEAHEQLEEQGNEANQAISSWETKADELEKELDKAEDQILRLEEVLIDSDSDKQTSIVVAAENLVRQNRNFSHKILTNEGKLNEMKLEQQELKHLLSLKSQDKLEEERDRLIGVVAQLEEELREANATLQACVTDGSSDRATEFAANAIRDDIQNLRNQLIEYQQKFEDEKAAKEVADLEIEGLREDVAALLSLADHEKNPAVMKKLTTKSIEKLQKIEHAEIDDLRKSLFRALDELELTRFAERDSNETISKLRLQISMYEQEIIAAKSEVNFLSEAMEELRQTEDSKRASLEYRIGSLENENDVVRKYQANELEDLRKELAQITMEKDLLSHQLKDTQKTNASLLLAAQNEEDGKAQQHADIHSECSKLRIENAHLLTIAAEDKAKNERRLRELLSGQAASSELDVIMERELRLSAETELQTMKEELGQLRNGKHSEMAVTSTDCFTLDELNKLRTALESLKEENAGLQAIIDEEASKSKQTIDVLTDECRRAQAKAFKLDRDTRTEIAVQSEISKMRLSAMSSPGETNSLNNDFLRTSINHVSLENHEAGFPSSSEVFDLIRKQKQEIQEERMMYSETLKEYEDLLALVAQQDLEKSCLREKLVEVAGDDVADEAIKKAEEFAVIRYGNAVKVSN